jgi:hypothetical protein
VDDAGIVTRLVARNCRFLFDDRQAETGTQVQQLTRGRESKNAGTDDDDVIRPRPLHGRSLYDRAA